MFLILASAVCTNPCFFCSTLQVTKYLESGKAPGPDGLKKLDLNLAMYEVSSISTITFQYSLDIPAEWKRANVVPIFDPGIKFFSY